MEVIQQEVTQMGKVMMILAFMTLLCGIQVAARAEDQPPAEPMNGTVTGILTAKGADWIEVKADGAREPIRYVPFWRGGLPREGGGYDQDTLKAIKSLVVPNRIKVVWEMQERRRIVSVEMLIPEKKEGTTSGKVTAKGETWLEVTPDKEPPVRFWPRWVGGLPKDGGGLDKAIIATIKELKVGDWVEVKWSYDERLRAIEIHKVEAPAPPAATAEEKK